ncbi:glycosyltransferase [Marinobacter panjinensis]|uniref:Glycosyltransferase n=1 Tax=Marinobacter panjinensis TaxID=2576384 RepID=A0A4U6R0K9_9GAMM|nr:glycosyltransferase [Marinobacter panjinensis]MCR8915829.1 glycosyltransferase [Marinobacter panjinensis]TKV67194.1 glycosyltransferase [Marinobacter panjinensis]
MESNPLVTVITPTYNRADFLPEAIDGVLAQTFGDFELIVVDDGSTDNSSEILADYEAKDSRVRIFRQENQGQSVARNRALAEARGEYICFLDSDNYWPPEKLQQQVALFDEHPEVDVIYGDTITIDENGVELTRHNMTRYSGHIAKWMLRDNCVSMNTAMARRKCFDDMGGMSGQRRVADDYDLWLKFSAQFQFLYVPEFWAYYRVMDDQISSDKTARFASNEAIIHDFRRSYPDAVSEEEFNAGFAVFYVRKARYLAAVGRKKEAFRELYKALRHRPFGKVVWRGVAAVTLR